MPEVPLYIPTGYYCKIDTMDYTIYEYSLGTALVLMLFFAACFLMVKTPDKPIFGNYIRSCHLMGVALLLLSANYSVHLFCNLRFLYLDAAILMNLSTYFISYWLFSSALTALLDRFYLTRRRFLRHILYWLLFSALSGAVLIALPQGAVQHVGLLLMALWLLAYCVYLSRKLILTYRWAVRLFDDTHSEHIAAYIRWMSAFTWWAIVYGVSCGLLTFLPDRYVFLWILSSIPFYIYLYRSYMNYLLFYEQVESILEKETPEDVEEVCRNVEEMPNETPAYHANIEKKLTVWVGTDGYTSPGLTIEELAGKLGTNRTYLSAYIKSTYHVSFREWIAGLRLEYAKRMLIEHQEWTIARISETSGVLSQSYFMKIFKEKEGCSPARWRKAQA